MCSLTRDTDEGPNPCEMVKQPRYRKGPDVCFDEAKQVKLNLQHFSVSLKTAVVLF